MFLVRISIKKRAGGRFFSFVIYYFLLHAFLELLGQILIKRNIKTLFIKNNKKREAALKNEAGGDEKHVFFLLGLINKRSATKAMQKTTAQSQQESQKTRARLVSF